MMTLRYSETKPLVRSGLSLIVLLALTTAQAMAQETPQETAALDRTGMWKVLNAAVFAALLGWFIAKKAPAFFNARSADIQKAIQDATGLKLNADLRYSEIDRKMATLGEEVKRIREQSRVEFEREHQRLREQTASEIARMQQNAKNEIEALRSDAAKRVRAHTADLAIGLAERRLHDQLAQGGPQNPVDDFIHLIEHEKN